MEQERLKPAKEPSLNQTEIDLLSLTIDSQYAETRSITKKTEERKLLRKWGKLSDQPNS